MRLAQYAGVLYFSAFHAQARAWVATQQAATGRLPDREAYRRQSLAILAGMPPP
jgi:hypothetical protein